jgi:hypothetical protein
MKKITKVFVPILILASCSTGTIEEQVADIKSETLSSRRRDIALSIADSLDLKSTRLISEMYTSGMEVKAIETFSNIISRYANSQDYPSEMDLCVKSILSPESVLKGEERLRIIREALTKNQANLEFVFSVSQILSQYESEYLLDFIEFAKFNTQDEDVFSILETNDKIHSYLLNNMTVDADAKSLLARIGAPVAGDLKRLMKSSVQGVRFAAGDVLVEMIKYHPEVVAELIDALDDSSMYTIAKNHPFYIRLGRSGSESLLLRTLDDYFTVDMCLDFLNCGSSIIMDGAERIAYEHGYEVYQSPGAHSGPRWGSESP